MKTEHDHVLMDHEQFNKLRSVEKHLYGDGSTMTEDTRRDLANYLNRLLNEIRDQNKTGDNQ